MPPSSPPELDQLPGMYYKSTHARSDGCKLAFQSSLPLDDSNKTIDTKYCLILIHGFSGSSHYFTRNVAALSRHFWVVCPDLRGHGASGRSSGGYHVARLAADLQDLVAHLRQEHSSRRSSSSSSSDIRFVPVGCSIGAAILWTYAELFGTADFAGYVFVDQAPLQDRRVPATTGCDDEAEVWDETKANMGCYDEATLRSMQRSWIQDPAASYRGLVEGCLGYYSPRQKLPEESPMVLHDNREIYADLTPKQRQADVDFFTKISALGDRVWLGRLIEDHTRYDHREACELFVDRPSLVMAGRRSACFPLDGMRETVRRIEKGVINARADGNKGGTALAGWSVFDSGHWLYYEEPERFHREVLEFVDRL